MKKLLALILALVMCFSLVACGGEAKDDAEASKPVESKPVESKPVESKPTETQKEEEKVKTLDDWVAESEGEEYKVLYIPSWAASEYFQNSFAAWQKQFAEYGWELEMQGPTKFNVEDQMAVLEAALVSQEYDAIILYPIIADPYAAAYEELWETYHTPIIVWGMAEASNAGTYYLMNDERYKMIGEYMAEMAIDYVDENEDYFSQYEGEGIPTVIVGEAQTATQNVRVLRAMELLEADGRFKIVEHYENVKDSEALAYGETIALNHPEAEIIIAYSDTKLVHMVNAFKTVGGMKDTLRIFGCDGTKAVVSLLKEEGADSFAGGSTSSNHQLMGDLISYTIKAGVPAAKEGITLEGLTERNVDIFVNEENSVNITAANANEFFND